MPTDLDPNSNQIILFYGSTHHIVSYLLYFLHFGFLFVFSFLFQECIDDFGARILFPVDRFHLIDQDLDESRHTGFVLDDDVDFPSVVEINGEALPGEEGHLIGLYILEIHRVDMLSIDPET
jgi:hypothetical protein